MMQDKLVKKIKTSSACASSKQIKQQSLALCDFCVLKRKKKVTVERLWKWSLSNFKFYCHVVLFNNTTF